MAKAARLEAAVTAGLSELDRLDADAELARLRAEVSSLKGRYAAALKRIDAERERSSTLAGLSGIKPKQLRPGKRKRDTTPATVIVALSDWHVEERVDPATVNQLNDFDLDVCDRRIEELAERFSHLLEHERQLVPVDRVVVWLGGDFISGHIHPDTAEMAQLAPLAATRWAGERIRGFLDMVAGMASEVIVVTSSGNHGRSTEKLRVGTELDHSFEQDLYLRAAAEERSTNIRWQVGTGYLNYLDLDGFRVRFHHGHAIRYGGGVGGITIPTNKAIGAWNAVEHADLTVFGHWHQFSWMRAGRYVSNGSLIGHSAYATRIKAAYEPPCQSFIVIDHGRQEVTSAKPIFCDRDLKGRRR